MSNKITIARMEGTRKRGRHRKIWSNESEDDGTTMGLKNRQAVVKGNQQWRVVVLESKTHNGP
jgi:hypothetical protein